jgi:hypothetical protein
MGVELMSNVDQLAGKRIIEGLIAKYGCLPSAADGPIIARFDPKALEEAIMHEVKRAGEYGWPKVTIHMDIPDAILLAQFLRRT